MSKRDNSIISMVGVMIIDLDLGYMRKRESSDHGKVHHNVPVVFIIWSLVNGWHS